MYIFCGVMSFCDLPDDCIYEILRHLPAVEAYKLTLVCSRLRLQHLYSHVPQTVEEFARICIMMNYGWAASLKAMTYARTVENGIIKNGASLTVSLTFTWPKTPADVWDAVTNDYVDKRARTGRFVDFSLRVTATRNLYREPDLETVRTLSYDGIFDCSIPAKPEFITAWCNSNPNAKVDSFSNYVTNAPRRGRLHMTLHSLLWVAGIYSRRYGAGPPLTKFDIKRLIGAPTARLCETHSAKLLIVALIPELREIAGITPWHFTTMILEFGPPGLIDSYPEICQPVLMDMTPQAIYYLMHV